MGVMQHIWFGNTLAAWMISAVIASLFLIALTIAKKVFLKRLAIFAEGTQTDLDDLLVAVLRRTKFFTLIAASIYAGSQWVTLGPKRETFGSTALMLTLLFQGAIWAIAASQHLLDQALRKRVETDAGSVATLHVLGFAVKVAIWSILLLMVLDNLGVDVTGLVAGLGIGGIAVALAVQNILGDLFASLSIILDKPFEVGDFIIIGEFLGSVEHIGIKTTRLRSLSGEQVIFSNSDLLGSRVRNYKRMSERRVVFSLGVTFQTPQDKLRDIPAIVKGIVEGQASVRFDRAHFKEIGDSALLFEVVYFVLNPDYTLYMDTQQSINLEIMGRFADSGISFAYPTQSLFLERPLEVV
jgi:small-conductance mechanosensitive channel